MSASLLLYLQNVALGSVVGTQLFHNQSSHYGNVNAVIQDCSVVVRSCAGRPLPLLNSPERLLRHKRQAGPKEELGQLLDLRQPVILSVQNPSCKLSGEAREEPRARATRGRLAQTRATVSALSTLIQLHRVIFFPSSGAMFVDIWKRDAGSGHVGSCALPSGCGSCPSSFCCWAEEIQNHFRFMPVTCPWMLDGCSL